MYRWHRLSFLLLAVVMLGLSGCQSTIRTNDLSNSSQTPLGKIEDGKDEIGIQMPGAYAVWQAIYLPTPSNYSSIDIVTWSFTTDLYPPSGHTWNTIGRSTPFLPAGPWHMQNGHLRLYEPSGSVSAKVELGFVLRKGDLSSGHWAWYQVYGFLPGEVYMDNNAPYYDPEARNCKSSSVQYYVQARITRLQRNSDGTWKWMIYLQCNNGSKLVTFNTRASAIDASWGSWAMNPAVWAEWEFNTCPSNDPYAWKKDNFSNQKGVFFRDVYYEYVPKGTNGSRTRKLLNAADFLVGYSEGGSTLCTPTAPFKVQYQDGRIGVHW